MDFAPKPASDAVHDETLIDWFLALTPSERLAELESRLEFFNAVRGDGDTKLPPVRCASQCDRLRVVAAEESP